MTFGLYYLNLFDVHGLVICHLTLQINNSISHLSFKFYYSKCQYCSILLKALLSTHCHGTDFKLQHIGINREFRLSIYCKWNY